MKDFIDLGRNFFDLSDQELPSPEVLASLNDSFLRPQIGWSELLKWKRVILLAEAGSGKTIEMREQAHRLTSNGQFAAFVPLEALDRDQFVEALSTPQQEKFFSWKEIGDAPGWFFLDAVDELKLTAGKLDRALLRLSNAIHGHLDRAHVIISSRPNDWRPHLDLAMVQDRLPLPKQRSMPTPSSDEVFLAAIRNEVEGTPATSSDDADGGGVNTVKTVALLSLSDKQIERFARRCGVSDAVALLEEIKRQRAWDFARRPLDLSELIASWKTHGRLGTRAVQHETNISAKLRDSPDRPDRDVLTEDKAQRGAERLAIAMALTRTRTIRSPEQSLDAGRAEGALDASQVLPDWTEGERQALLRRGLFDPATYGRVRFHHRSVQEYLAARFLRGLRDKGMSTAALLRLIFAERYGVEVVIPSLRPVAAWLAIWDGAVRRELTRREPETLLSSGDPESLSTDARRDLLRSFANQYGEGGWRGLNVPIDEVRRLAHTDLASTIRDLWGDGPQNPDLRELLIEIIWQGRVRDCADLAERAAYNVSWETYHRAVAIRALHVCGCHVEVRKIVDAILTDERAWPLKIVYGVAAELFPSVISVDELVLLMERAGEDKKIAGDFGWVSRQIVEAIEPSSPVAADLRDQMAELIFRGRSPGRSFHQVHSRFGDLSPALAVLCERQLSDPTVRSTPGLIRASAIASRFGENEVGSHRDLKSLKDIYGRNANLRSEAFWQELQLMDELVEAKDDWGRLHHVQYDGLIEDLGQHDRTWLEQALADERHPERRPVALHVLITLWRQRGQPTSDLDVLRRMVRGSRVLKSILADRTAPPMPNPALERSEREHREWERKRREEEDRRVQKWVEWRQQITSNPEDAFSAEKEVTTLSVIYEWLQAHASHRNRFYLWDERAINVAFGKELTARATTAMKRFWRATNPLLWSERPPGERSSVPYTWIYGLCGVSVEATAAGWADRLRPEEARLATVYATLELNGFAPFITDLLPRHASEVEAVLGREIDGELALCAGNEYLPVLQDLAYSDTKLKKLIAPRLLAGLRTFPTNEASDSVSRLAHSLDQILRILEEALVGRDREIVSEECAKRYEAAPLDGLALTWLRGLFRFNAVRAADVLIKGRSYDGIRAIETFASLFGDHDAVVFEIKDSSVRARVLRDLVRAVYAHVHPEDDEVHEGVFTPNTRDHAERARNFLLSSLLDTPGSEARQMILELSAEADFAHFPDRLRLLARERAAKDAEFDPYSPKDVVDLEARYEAAPRDSDELFRVVIDRLEELADDVRHHDFTDRRTLRTIADEAEMQRTLAWRLSDRANSAFVVTREEEVADRKRTDIRVLVVRGEGKVTIEVKLADRWTVAAFERALRDQLVGQYLRHRTSAAGCLLLTYNGRKSFWLHPSTRSRLDFREVVAHLDEKAREIEREQLYSTRLRVFGLDLTDPR